MNVKTLIAVENVQQVTDLAKGISDYGAMAIMAAIYLLLSAAMMIAIFKWFKSIINQILEDNREKMIQTLEEERKQTEMLVDISEGLRSETHLRIQNVASFAFDLSVEQVCRLIKTIREQNHIADHETTASKVRKLVANIHKQRNNRFDHFTFHGRKLSSYCKEEWVERVAQIVESEIYHVKGPNNKRAFENVTMVYDDIKNEFYHNLNS